MQPAPPEPTAEAGSPAASPSAPATTSAPAEPAQPDPQALPTEKAPPAAQSQPERPPQTPPTQAAPPQPTPQALPTQAAPPYAQAQTPPLELKTPLGTAWGIGVSAGTTSGIGISARRHFENRLGVHFGGIYIYAQETHWGNLGGQLLYTFARSRKTRLYGLLAAQFVLNHSKELRYDNFAGGSRSVDVTKSTLFVGPGVGLEIHFTPHFGWALEVPTSFVFALEGDKDRLPMGGVVNFIPAANTSFTFYFK